MVRKIRIGGNRTNIGVRALFKYILLISGLLAVIDNKFNVVVLAVSGFDSSQELSGQSNVSNYGSSVVVGDEETENSATSKVASELSAENSALDYDTSNSKGSSEPLPIGASLFQGDSSVAFDDSPPDGLPSGLKITSPGVIEYGYNNIPESSVDAKTPDSGKDRSEFSDPVIMESLENTPKSKTDSHRASFEVFDGSILEKELSNNFKKMKMQEKLLEPLTENVEITSSLMKTPKTPETYSVSKFSEPETHAVHADSHIESPPKTPDDFVINDYEIKVEANPIEQKKISQDQVGSEVVFEETSESKLPIFLTGEGESRVSQPGEESSQLTSGISETSKFGSSSLVNVESSSLFPQKEDNKYQTTDQKETSFSTDISKNIDLSIKEGAKNLEHSFGFVDESKASGRVDSVHDLSPKESSFVNPKTEDLSMIPSESEATLMDVSNKINQPFVQEPSKTASISIEPPSPPSSAVEERTVGNKRIYSGPYIRTSATTGKVSPRIASVINSLVGQFERFNLYGAGNKNEEIKPGEQNISNKYVSSMKSNFDRASKDSSVFVPQNSQENELVEALKKEMPRNNFLFKNRFEEMKATQSSSGKTLLQEEIEKLRGTYRSTLSKRFSTGKTWERPSNVQSDNKPIQVTYSGDEFLDKVKLINPNYNQGESQPVETTKEVDANLVEESRPEQSENEENTQYLESSHTYKQESPKYSVPPNNVENIPEKTQETEMTTDEGYSDAESFSKVPTTGFEDSDQSSMDETQLNLNFQKAEEGSINDSPKNIQATDELKVNSFANMPFSYINTLKELPVGLKPQDAPVTEIPEAIMDRRSQIDELENQDNQLENQSTPYQSDSAQNKELNIPHPKDMELSPEQEKEINVCYNKAKKIKTINFGLQLTEHPSSVVTETFISEFTKYKPKIREFVNFAQETLRVAENYNKKRSWRKKTKKFKLEFLELSNEFLQHSKAIRSLLHHLIQVTNPNIMDILQQIITGHNQDRHSLLVQCKILYQAFYSYKNSVRSKLLKKISDLNFVDVLNKQIKIYLEQRFHPIVKAIQSNKYLKKKLSRHIPDVNILESVNQYQDLSQVGGGEQTTPNKKKGNKITRFFRRLFKKPSCIKCPRSKKQSKKQKLNNK